MDTMFDILRRDGELVQDKCPRTGKPHQYYEYDSGIVGDKWVQVLRCKKCKHESVGWMWR